jgi:hypothetical protein
VSSFLSIKTSFVLCIPPRQKFVNSSNTSLYEAGLTPASVLHLIFEKNEQEWKLNETALSLAEDLPVPTSVSNLLIQHDHKNEQKVEQFPDRGGGAKDDESKKSNSQLKLPKWFKIGKKQ